MNILQIRRLLSESTTFSALDVGRPCPACEKTNAVGIGQLNGWDMVECPACQLIYSKRVPSYHELQQIYDEAYRNGGMYDMHLTELKHLVLTGRTDQGFYRNNVFLKRYKAEPGDKLLEIGCGIGSFLIAAKRRGWDVEGVDVSAQALEASSKFHKIPIHHGTLDDINLAPSTYKAIVCWEVLEHLPSPGKTLDHIRKLLRTDGILVCSVPNCSDRVPQFALTSGPASLPPVHLNFWTVDSFRAFVKRHHFNPLLLFPKRSLWSMAGGRQRPAKLLWNQLGAMFNLREGDTIYAVLSPDS